MSIESKAAEDSEDSKSSNPMYTVEWGEWEEKTGSASVFTGVNVIGSTSSNVTASASKSNTSKIGYYTQGNMYQVQYISYDRGKGTWGDDGGSSVGDTIVSKSASVSVTTSGFKDFVYDGSNAPKCTVSCTVTATGKPVKLYGDTYYLNRYVTYEETVTVHYRVREGVYKSIADIAQDTNETTHGILDSITDFFGGFFENLINAVIGLFVPSSEEMSDLFGQLNDFFSERFGFLYAPFDYIIQLMNVFLNDTGSTGITLPGFSIMGQEVWPDITYDLSEDPLVGQILGYVRMGTGVLLAGYFIMFLQDFFKERFGTG